jgi:cephalosporin hydroxylase
MMLRGHTFIRYRLADAVSRVSRGNAGEPQSPASDQPEAIYEFVNANLPGEWIQHRSEIVSFLALLSDTRPQRICEIGTLEGGTTVALGRYASTLMIGVDLYVRRKPMLRQLAGHSRSSMVLIDGNSRRKAVLRRVERALAGELLDVLFIDGDHSFAGVRDDFLAYRHYVRDGGLIAFHDIVPDSLQRQGVQTARWSGEVPQFWSAVKAVYPHEEIVEDASQDGAGIGVLHYSRSAEVSAELLRLEPAAGGFYGPSK